MNLRSSLKNWSDSAEKTSKNGVLVLVCMLVGLIGTAVALSQSLFGEDKDDQGTKQPAKITRTTNNSLAETRSAPELLEIQTSTDDSVTNFVLPIDAPLATFPFENTPSCSGKQRTWLLAHGDERQTTYWSELRNSDTGTKSQLALRNMRLDGTFDTRQPEPVMLFDCPDAGMADVVEMDQELTADEEARNSDTGGPLAFNLATGESGQVITHLTGTAGFDGYISLDVASGTETVVQSLTDQKLTIPAIGTWGTMTVSPGSGPGLFYCEVDDNVFFEECRADEIPGLVRRFGQPLRADAPAKSTTP